MLNPRLAGRYAKSLIDLAVEKDQLEKVYADMQWLQTACKGSRELVNMLRSPVVRGDKKEKIIDAITNGKLSEMTRAFIMLMIRKGREGYLPEVITAFVSQYKALKKIYAVKLTTAIPLSEELKNAIIHHIRSTSELQNIELETIVNSGLIGGFVLQAGDKLVEASIAYDLKAIAKQFDNNDFIYKIR